MVIIVVWCRSAQGAATQQKSSAPVAQAKQEEEEDDDDIDLFGSDDDEEAEKIKEQRLKDYAEKKAKKPALIAKSSILLDVKPVSLFGARSHREPEPSHNDITDQLLTFKLKRNSIGTFFCALMMHLKIPLQQSPTETMTSFNRCGPL